MSPSCFYSAMRLSLWLLNWLVFSHISFFLLALVLLLLFKKHIIFIEIFGLFHPSFYIFIGLKILFFSLLLCHSYRVHKYGSCQLSLSFLQFFFFYYLFWLSLFGIRFLYLSLYLNWFLSYFSLSFRQPLIQ